MRKLSMLMIKIIFVVVIVMLVIGCSVVVKLQMEYLVSLNVLVLKVKVFDNVLFYFDECIIE